MDADNVNLLLYARYSTHQSFFSKSGESERGGELCEIEVELFLETQYKHR
jgi:hypothetical protein